MTRHTQQASSLLGAFWPYIHDDPNEPGRLFISILYENVGNRHLSSVRADELVQAVLSSIEDMRDRYNCQYARHLCNNRVNVLRSLSTWLGADPCWLPERYRAMIQSDEDLRQSLLQGGSRDYER